MSDAPVCHISPQQQISQPPAGKIKLPSIPPVSMPSFRAGTDPSIITAMQSMAATITALKQMVELLSGQQAHRSSGQAPGGQAGPGRAAGPGAHGTPPSSKKTQSRFFETNRATAEVKIENPEDPTQFVKVRQINSLELTDAVTGETWQWNR